MIKIARYQNVAHGVAGRATFEVIAVCRDPVNEDF